MNKIREEEMDLKKLKTQLFTKERVDILFKKSIIY